MVVLKHMILLKQNRWPPEIYNNYTALLKRDVLFTVQNNYDLDISFLCCLPASFIPPHPRHSRANRRERHRLLVAGSFPSCLLGIDFAHGHHLRPSSPVGLLYRGSVDGADSRGHRGDVWDEGGGRGGG